MHDHDPTVKDWECQEVKARPCTECGAHVCNVSIIVQCWTVVRRYSPQLTHLICRIAASTVSTSLTPTPTTFSGGKTKPSTTSRAKQRGRNERIYVRVFDLNGGSRYRNATYHGHGLDKAWDIFCKRFTGMLSICDECFDNVDELSVSCRCDMFDHFVGKRWLCIPCLLVEETKDARDSYQGRCAHLGALCL
jgi:hypothetical protein